MKSERSAFPKSGDFLAVIKFLCKLSSAQRDCAYVGAAKDRPGTFNFCIFSEPVVPSREQTEIMLAVEAVTKFASPAAKTN